MQEKPLLTQETRITNIHSMDFGAISYNIFGSSYQKSDSFLANDSLDFGYLGNHNTIAIITSGHGYTNNGGVQTSDKDAFTPNDLKNLDIGDNLELVIFENCYQSVFSAAPNPQ